VNNISRLWHVTVTLSGDPMEPLMIRAALARLVEQRPFLSSVRYAPDTAEIGYWDEGDTLVDVGSLALRLWNEYRESAKLPAWEVVGLEIVERPVHRQRRRFDNLTELAPAPQLH
jgi:hypothetical protein